MTATIMSPTPALPAVRKSSVWEKMFSGFKIGGKKESMSDEQLRQSFFSTGFEDNTLPLKKRNASSATMASEYRRPSAAPPSKSHRSTRAASVCSNMSRRSSKKWWRSSQPEEEDFPPVPALDNRYTVFGSHNPEVDSTSLPASRRPSYVPRNAAGGFLRSTTNTNMKMSTQEGLDETSRRLNSVSSIKPASASLKPAEIKTTELRKDSHAQAEKHGMFSMAGICDIIDEEYNNNDSAVSPTTVKRADTPTRVSVERSDSANASLPEGVPA